MKFAKVFALFAAVALAVPSDVAAQGGSKPTVAVLDFYNSAIGSANAELAPLSKGIADMLIGELAANPGIRVVERDQIQKVLEEQKLSIDGRVENETAVKVGKLVGAHYMVTGTFVTDRSGRMRFAARVFNTENSLVVFPTAGGPTGVVDGKIDNFMDLVVQLAAKINSGAKLPDIPARVGEARKEAAKKVPYEAIALYSKGLAAKDAGNKQEAVTLFQKSLAKFPEFEKASAELKKLQ